MFSFEFPQDAYLGPFLIVQPKEKHKTQMQTTVNVFEYQACIHFVVCLVFKNILCAIRQSTIQVFVGKTLMVIQFATILNGIFVVKHMLVTFCVVPLLLCWI